MDGIDVAVGAAAIPIIIAIVAYIRTQWLPDARLALPLVLAVSIAYHAILKFTELGGLVDISWRQLIGQAFIVGLMASGAYGGVKAITEKPAARLTLMNGPGNTTTGPPRDPSF